MSSTAFSNRPHHILNFIEQIAPPRRAVAQYCRPLRGLAGLRSALPTQGSRTRPGLHAVARFAGCPLRRLVTVVLNAARAYASHPQATRRSVPIEAATRAQDPPH